MDAHKTQGCFENNARRWMGCASHNRYEMPGKIAPPLMYGVRERSAPLKRSVVGWLLRLNLWFGVGWLRFPCVTRKRHTVTFLFPQDSNTFDVQLLETRCLIGNTLRLVSMLQTNECHILVTPGTCRVFIEATRPRF